MRRLLLLLVLSGLAAAGWVLWVRPPNSPAVEIALDDGSARRFAARQGYPYDQLLEAFRAAGGTTLLLREKTLGDLLTQGQTGYPESFPVEVAVFRGRALAAGGAIGGPPLVPPEELSLDEVYVVVRRNPALADWLERMLAARLGAHRVRRVPVREGAGAQVTVLGVHADLGPGEAPWEGLMGMPLGILPADVEAARRHGLRVAYSVSQRWRQEGTPPWRPADLEALLRLPGPPGLVWVAGIEVPGYPDRVGETARLLAEQGVTLALWRDRSGIGPALPAGMAELVSRLGNRAVKAYGVSYADRVEDWVTAVKDRNIRFFVFEAFVLSGDGEQDVRTMTGALRRFVESLQAYGFSPGPAAPAAPFRPPRWALAVMGLAAAAGALALAYRFWAPGPDAPAWQMALAALGSAALLAGVPALVLVHPAGVQGAALLAAVTLPSLGVISAASRGLDEQIRSAALVGKLGERALDRSLRADALLGLRFSLRVALYGVAAGLLIQGLLADRRFWLEVDLFRGVKVELLAPVAVFLAYWAWQRRERLLRETREWLDRTLDFRTVALGLAGLVALALLLLRSEYAGAEVGGVRLQAVSTLELQVRALLERTLYARPRFKEFMVGYPALFLAAYLLRRGRRTWGLAGMAAGAVAAASVANTFSHAHVPPGLSLLRTAHGLWLGALVGVGLLALVHLAAAYLAGRLRRDTDG
ncbi:MAG: DUF5693 family protein [Bacillota bacterium]